jgi:2-C-methyl-D-erythritol 4-phosphate cytidylyltransferase/2-C-methyl-D-erythritol 2,4-cyclodiphosphate synthase
MYYLIIAASGLGRRTGSSQPKQFMMIKNKTILEHTIEPFIESGKFEKIVVTTPQSGIPEDIKARLKKQNITLVPGGKRRSDSITEALKILEKTALREDRVFIHDGVRPFVSKKLISTLLEKSLDCDALIPTLPLVDTIKTAAKSKILKTIDRSVLVRAQTPQVFSLRKILKAYEQANLDNFISTDDSSVYETYAGEVTTIQGDEKNIKITTKEDIWEMLENMTETRTGFGYDVHRLVEGRDLVLCGEKLDHPMGLLGHSDADVALHALMDSLLGAAGLTDIGHMFPDTSSEYKGISSLILLKKVWDLLNKKGMRIVNIDILIVTEKPKIAPFVDKMKQNISKTIDLAPDRINIKATTTEGLGFIGEKKGIAAKAVSTIKG